MRPRTEVKKGDRYGFLTVIKEVEMRIALSGKKYRMVECVCDCGNIKVVEFWNLRSGRNISCGCYGATRSVTHGMYKTRLYSIWHGMKQRCKCINAARYSDYGGRGIKACAEWYDFINFKKDMYESYLDHFDKFGEKNTSLDRIDNNSGYNKENCRWATLQEQTDNSRTVKYFKATDKDGNVYVGKNVTKFCREHSLASKRIFDLANGRRKSHKGWTIEYTGSENNG